MVGKTYTAPDGGIVHWFGDQAVEATRQATIKALQATGIEATKRVKLSMGGERFSAAERQAARLTKGGKSRTKRVAHQGWVKGSDGYIGYTYYTSGTGINAAAPSHRPRSAPGEPPAVQTGRLMGSIGSEVNRENLTMRFGSIKLADGKPVEYAAYLEFGAPANNLLPRPYLRPQVPWALKFFQERLRAEMGGH